MLKEIFSFVSPKAIFDSSYVETKIVFVALISYNKSFGLPLNERKIFICKNKMALNCLRYLGFYTKLRTMSNV